MRHRHRNTVVSVVFLFISLMWTSQAVVLERDTEKVVQLPARPTATETFAAEELARYLGEILDQQIRVVTEGEEAGAYSFYVGRTTPAAQHETALLHSISDIKTDSFVIDSDAQRSVLAGGGDRGTLYAVYAMLESLGCQWFEPGPKGEVVPRLEQLDLKEGVQIDRPVFAVREIGRGIGHSDEETIQYIDWAVKNRLNRLYNARAGYYKPSIEPDVWIKRGGNVVWQHICHNTPFMFPNEKYFDEHPEYFSLYQGKRIKQGKEGGYVCTTHPEVRQIAADYIIDWFDQHPEGHVMPICPPDGAVKWCEHDACRAQGGVNFMAGEDGSMTRRQVNFINAVARKVAEKHPDRYILNLAYSRYVEPYPGLQMEPNTLTQICHGYTGNGSFVHPITSSYNDDARKSFRQWADSGTGGIGIWDYFILQVAERSGSPLTPLGFGEVVHSMMKFIGDFENPYKVYFTQAGDTLQESNPLIYYLIARLSWNPDQPLAELRNDYAKGIFGKAWKPVAAYLEALDATYAASDWNPDIWRGIMVPSPRVFTPAFLEQARHYIAEADALIPEADIRAKGALDRIETSIHYAEIAVLPKQLITEGDGVWRLERGVNAYRFNANTAEDNSEMVEQVRQQALTAGFLDEAMDKVIFRSRVRSEEIVWLENERLRVAVLPGVGGRILRLIDRTTGLNLLYEPAEDLELEDPGLGYVRYGGYEEYTAKAFASPGWEMKMSHQVRQTDQGREMVLEGVTPGGIHIHRVLRLASGGDPSLELSTRLTNQSDGSIPAKIRVHPEMKLGSALSEVEIFIRTSDEAWESMSMRAFSLVLVYPPHGEGGVYITDAIMLVF